MPRLTDATRERRRGQIAEAAIRRFALSGLAATSMADIIEEAGMSAGSIYSHFESKADLVRYASAAMLDARLEALRREVEAAETPLSPGQVLALMLGDGVGDPAPAHLLLQIWADVQRDDGLAVIAVENVRRVRSLARKAVAPWAEAQASARGDDADTLADDLADMLVAVVQGFVVRLAFDRDADPSDLLRRLVRVLG